MSNTAPNQSTPAKRENMLHIDAAIRLVRACGPVTAAQIAEEIRVQVIGADSKNCRRLADLAIAHGLGAGWLARYDGDSFCVPQN